MAEEYFYHHNRKKQSGSTQKMALHGLPIMFFLLMSSLCKRAEKMWRGLKLLNLYKIDNYYKKIVHFFGV